MKQTQAGVVHPLNIIFVVVVVHPLNIIFVVVVVEAAYVCVLVRSSSVCEADKDSGPTVLSSAQ